MYLHGNTETEDIFQILYIHILYIVPKFILNCKHLNLITCSCEQGLHVCGYNELLVLQSSPRYTAKLVSIGFNVTLLMSFRLTAAV